MRMVLVVCGMAVILAGYPARPLLAQGALAATPGSDGQAGLTALRAVVDQAFGDRILDHILESLATQSDTDQTRADRAARYAALIQDAGVFGALSGLWAEQGLELREPLTEAGFLALAGAFLRARDRGDFAGDDLEFLAEDMAGIVQLLSQGKDIPGMYRGLIMPVLPETAHLHPALARIAASEENLRKAEADRQAAEADRQAAEADLQAAEADRQAAEADLQAAEADRQAAEARANAAEADRQAVQADIAAVEARIVEAKRKLAAYEKTLRILGIPAPE